MMIIETIIKGRGDDSYAYYVLGNILRALQYTLLFKVLQHHETRIITPILQIRKLGPKTGGQELNTEVSVIIPRSLCLDINHVMTLGSYSTSNSSFCIFIF